MSGQVDLSVCLEGDVGIDRVGGNSPFRGPTPEDYHDYETHPFRFGAYSYRRNGRFAEDEDRESTFDIVRVTRDGVQITPAVEPGSILKEKALHPIETAAKRAVPLVILWAPYSNGCKGGYYRIGWWGEAEQAWRCQGNQAIEPTHWAPLPISPDAEPELIASPPEDINSPNDAGEGVELGRYRTGQLPIKGDIVRAHGDVVSTPPAGLNQDEDVEVAGVLDYGDGDIRVSLAGGRSGDFHYAARFDLVSRAGSVHPQNPIAPPKASVNDSLMVLSSFVWHVGRKNILDGGVVEAAASAVENIIAQVNARN